MEPNQGLLPSIIDRLTDPESEGTGWMRGYSIDQLMGAIRRDLEDLFNTHQSTFELPEGSVECRNSILTYGLPDLASIYTVAEKQRLDIAHLIEGIITRFEPRLRDVRVSLVGPSYDKSWRIKFHIDARLNVEPFPEVVFETILELTTGQASISAGGGT